MTALASLSDRHRAALSEAVEYVLGRYDPWAVIAAGTIVYGTADPNSDLDVYVLHDAPFRQRVQRWFRETPVEIFVNPESAVLEYIEREAREGRPSTAHMVAKGIVVHGAGSERVEGLRDLAQASLDGPPEWDELAITRARYGAATLVEDALDRREADPETAMRLLGQAVEKTLSVWFMKQGRYVPRAKAVLPVLDDADNDVATLARRFWGGGPFNERWAAALELTDAVLDTRGFIEWESDQQAV